MFQVAPEGEASEVANLETYDALTGLLTTSCATRFGSLALLSHLRWWLAEEAVNAGAYGEDWCPRRGSRSLPRPPPIPRP